MIDVQKTDSTATVVLSRPNRLNALTVEGWEQLGAVVHDLTQDSGVRAVVFRGAGERAFCTGIDVHELAQMNVAEASRALVVVEETLLRIEHLPMPTIAVLRGWALGAGCELSLACDLRVASDAAVLGLPMARLGIMASSRLIKRVVEYLGPGLTKELLFTGRTLTAREAAALRLINRLVPPARLDQAVTDVLREMSGSSFATLKAAKRAVALSSPLTVSYGAAAQASYYVDPHFHEAITAFLRKQQAWSSAPTQG